MKYCSTDTTDSIQPPYAIGNIGVWSRSSVGLVFSGCKRVAYILTKSRQSNDA